MNDLTQSCATRKKNHCRILLPVDAVVAAALQAQAACSIAHIDTIPGQGICADLGPATIEQLFSEALAECKTVGYG